MGVNVSSIDKSYRKNYHQDYCNKRTFRPFILMTLYLFKTWHPMEWKLNTAMIMQHIQPITMFSWIINYNNFHVSIHDMKSTLQTLHQGFHQKLTRILDKTNILINYILKFISIKWVELSVWKYFALRFIFVQNTPTVIYFTPERFPKYFHMKYISIWSILFPSSFQPL